MHQYTVQKDKLIPSQIEQFNQLKHNQNSFKELHFFPSDMKILETNDEIIFSFQIDEQIQAWNDNLAVKLEIPNIQCYITPARQLINLMLRFHKCGIHLPTFDLGYSILFYDASVQISLPINHSDDRLVNQGEKNQSIKIREFGLQYYSKNNNELPWKSMAYELVDKILEDNQNIEINEKMTVFCLGCAMYNLMNRNHIYSTIQENNDINDRRRDYHISLIFHCLIFERAIFVGLIFRCIKESPDDRPSLQQANEEMNRIKFFIECAGAVYNLKQDVLDPFNIFTQQLHSLVIQQLNLKKEEQITGRIYIMQNLAKIKFIVQLFQSDLLQKVQDESEKFKKYVVILLLTNIICTQLEELNQLIEYIKDPKKSNQQKMPLEFNDTSDELKEFEKNYAENYRIFLLKMYNHFLSLNVDNSLDEYYTIQTQDLKSIIVSIKGYVVKNNPQIQGTIDLLKYCLDNLSTIFYHDQLKRRFSPVIDELLKIDIYDEYDYLINMLLDRNKSQLHSIINQKIREK